MTGQRCSNVSTAKIKEGILKIYFYFNCWRSIAVLLEIIHRKIFEEDLKTFETPIRIFQKLFKSTAHLEAQFASENVQCLLRI